MIMVAGIQTNLIFQPVGHVNRGKKAVKRIIIKAFLEVFYQLDHSKPCVYVPVYHLKKKVIWDRDNLGHICQTVCL